VGRAVGKTAVPGVPVVEYWLSSPAAAPSFVTSTR